MKRVEVPPRPGWHAATVVVGSLLVVGSVLPASTGSPIAMPGVDKLLHASGYATFAGTTAMARHPRTRRALAAVVLGAVALGFAVEVVQLGLPTRAFSLVDAAANAAGAFAGVAVWQRYVGE